MVSQLSSRLLSGYGNASTESGSRKKEGKAKSESLGGYSADRETSSTTTTNSLPPVLIDLCQKRKIPTDAEEKAKRRKINEQNYAAAVAKKDLERAGIPFALLMHNRRRMNSRLFAQTRVSHLTASQVSSSPFLVQQTHGENQLKMHNVLSDYETAYANVVEACAFAYQTRTGMQNNNNDHNWCKNNNGDETSSTSSMSDTESDASHSSSAPILVLNARLDDTLAQEKKKKIDGKLGQRITATTTTTTTGNATSPYIISCAPSTSISMEEAIGVCDSSRILALSATPNKIIHVNASFSWLTGLDSSEILGKTFTDLVSLGSTRNEQSSSLASCAAASSEGTDKTVHVICSSKESPDETNNNDATAEPRRVKCRMKVTPIVSGNQGNYRYKNGNNGSVAASGNGWDSSSFWGGDTINNVTHFAIDLWAVEDWEKPNNDDTDNDATRAQHQRIVG